MSEARLVFGEIVYRVSHEPGKQILEIPERQLVLGHLDTEGGDVWVDDRRPEFGKVILMAYSDKPHIVPFITRDGEHGELIHDSASNPNPSLLYT